MVRKKGVCRYYLAGAYNKGAESRWMHGGETDR